MDLLQIFLIILLIIATAFFVATEFAIVKIRPSRLHQLIDEGNKNALDTQHVIEHLDAYLSACQLGITITALGLGWLGEPTVEKLIHPLLVSFSLSPSVEKVISFLLSFFIVTYLHVVLGELAPKTIAIQKAEAISLRFAKPIILFYKLTFPFIWLLNGSAALFIRLFGFKPIAEQGEVHTEEELRFLLSESYQKGEINQAEYGYVNKIFQFDERLAKEVMVPRTDMVCLDIEKPLSDHLKQIKEERYSRFPVIKENKDQIIGVIHTKELFLHLIEQDNITLEDLVHPVLTFLEITPIKKVLQTMQSQRTHIAILVDEYGGTAGLVSIEDILEEIVGEIRDEFDEEEELEIEIITPDELIVEGKTLLAKIEEYFAISLEKEEFDTVGGWLIERNNALKEKGVVQYADLTFTVLKKQRHRICKVRIKRGE